MSTNSSGPKVPGSIAWIFIGAVVLTACAIFPCGFGVGWFGRGIAPAGDKTQAKIIAAKTQVNWQDIQDRLAAKGWQTRRSGFADNKMLFCTEGSDGTGVDDEFIVREFPSIKEAKDDAARKKDFDQVEFFVWDRFTFKGSPGVKARLKTILP